MSDPNNPFIGNPFAQGADKQKKKPPQPTQTVSPSDHQRVQAQRTQVGLTPSSQAHSAARTTARTAASTARSAPPPTTSPRPSSAGRSARKGSTTTESNGSTANGSTTDSIGKKSSRTSSRGTTSSRQTTDSPSQTTPKTAQKTRKTSRKSQPANNSYNAASAPPAPPPAYSGAGYKVQVLAKIPVSTNTNLPGRDYLWFAVYPIIPRVGDCIFNNGMYFRVDTVILYENIAAGWCADIEVSYYPRRR